jgi:hypothetical protein
MDILKRCGISLAGGALLCAAAITAEAVTDPVSPDRAPHYISGLAAPVALTLLAGLLLLFIGIGGLVARLHQSGEGGGAAAVVIGVSLALAEIPHTILDMTAIPAVFDKLPAKQAYDLTENQFYQLPGLLSMVAILPLLIASIVLARRLWNSRTFPTWAPRAAVLLVALAIAELPLSSAAWWVPHGPVLLYVGIAGYGLGMLTRPAAAGRPRDGLVAA